MKICATCQHTYSDDVEFCPRDGARLASQVSETEQQLATGLSRRYRIVRRLGAGGMGTVFLARQIGVGNRPVALKILNRKLLDDPEFLLRFQNEAGSTGLIHHPNVVTIYESAQADDGTPYIAMEFLEGESLRQVLDRRGPLPVAEVAEILQQAARGLNAAHKQGIIHRDLKPDNIFLTRGDEGEMVAKVVDFGIAKLRESATHTQTGMVLGTPTYMSYEQASGMRSDELDARSDVYSLGVVAYEMLTGRVPFHADTPLGCVRKHMLEEPPPFRAAAPGLGMPATVEHAVMRALVKNRDLRYSSAPEFAREFAGVAAALMAAEQSKIAQPQSAERVILPPESLRPRGELADRRPAPVARQSDVAVQTPPELLHAASALHSPEASASDAQPEAERAPSPQPWGGGHSTPQSVPAAPAMPIGMVREPHGRGDLAPPQGNKRTRAVLIAVVAAVVVLIAAGLFWTYWPRAHHPPVHDSSAPVVNTPPANPTPPVQRPAATLRPPSPATENPAPPVNNAEIAKAAERMKKVKAALTNGDSYYDDGKYDLAIGAYQAGLTVDPANAQLRQRVQRARTAKAAEGSVPQ